MEEPIGFEGVEGPGTATGPEVCSGARGTINPGRDAGTRDPVQAEG